MKRPLVLDNFNIYLGETGTQWVCAGDIELPEITWTETEVSQAGMSGKVSVPLLGHSDSMKVTITAPVLSLDAIMAAAINSQLITARMAVQQRDSAGGAISTLPEVIVMRGMNSSFKPGTLKKGETMDTSLTFELDYLKIIINGKVAFEHDKWNNILIINGEDKLAAVRDAI